MSREEDLIRSTTHAIASTVSEVPPLRLETATDELGSPARAPRRARSGSGRQRRWWSWGAPVTAAAVVVALAIALVLVKDIPNGSAVPKNATTSTGPGGVPRYYVALSEQYGIVAGDSLTGKALATFAPPAGTAFQSVMAAADDRTFVVFALTSSTGSFAPSPEHVTLTGSWYEVQLAPGTAHPARLSRLPIKPWSWAAADYANPSPGEIFATALSESGGELAVADIPDVPAAKKQPPNWHEVKVFSVATGRLLHDWTENNPKTRLETVVAETSAGVPVGASALTWIDGDHALAFATSYDKSGTVTGTMRRLNVAGPASGNLMTDSAIIWSGTLTWSDQDGCYAVNLWPPLISADGKTISCVNEDSPSPSRNRITFDTDPLGTPAAIKPRFDYQVTASKMFAGPLSILWTSPSADVLIGVWDTSGGPSHARSSLSIGVISHGKFTPLRLPTSLHATASLQTGAIAF